MGASGTQVEIAFAGQEACVVEVGGGLRFYRAGGRELVDGYGPDERCNSGRGQVLAPWPNRLEDGAYDWDGEHQRVPIDDFSTGCAIHGLVRWSNWQATARSSAAVTMTLDLYPRPGYPFALRLEVEYRLSADGLAVTTSAENIGAEACPFGVGHHPYLLPDGPAVDDAVVSVPAGTRIPMGDRSLPLAPEPVAGEHDLREPRRVGSTKLDQCYTDLARDSDGLAWVVVDGITLWVDESWPYLQVFSGDLPDVARRSLAVEPMTCPSNAFRSGDGLIRLGPGERFTGRWGIAPPAAR